MRGQNKISAEHRSKRAYIYVRQSSMKQVIEHQESGRRQRELAQWVQTMGWPPSSVVVLDSDQGKSGQSSAEREAFKQLVGEVSLGEVGMVVSLYLSRLSRNNADWFPLIEMCGLTRALIADEEGIYDPNDPNDRLLLGLKGRFPRQRHSVFALSFRVLGGARRTGESCGGSLPSVMCTTSEAGW